METGESEMLADLRAIQQMPSGDFDAVLSAYAQSPSSTVGRASLLARLSQGNKPASVASLAGFIESIASHVASSPEYDAALHEIESTIDRLAENDSVAKAGWTKVKEAIAKVEPFFIESKVETIKSRFKRLTTVETTIDARPVFDLSRTRVVRMLHPVIVRLGTSDGDGFLFELHEDDFDLVERSIKSVRAKMLIIRSTYG